MRRFVIIFFGNFSKRKLINIDIFCLKSCKRNLFLIFLFKERIEFLLFLILIIIFVVGYLFIGCVGFIMFIVSMMKLSVIEKFGVNGFY